MNRRRILVMAAMAICWGTAPGRGLASADNSSPGFGSGSAFDRARTTVLNGTLPELPMAIEATPVGQALVTNPLWGIPISLLSATRDRPLFSLSRRPATAAAIGAPVRVRAVHPSAIARPALHVVGTVEGDSEGYAVFIDAATHDIVRLKTGEGRDGWILRSVHGREAVLYNNDRTEVLELPSLTGLSKE